MVEGKIREILHDETITLIFIGKPGCGKKTLGLLFQKYMDGVNPGRPTKISETGELFKSFLSLAPPWLKKRVYEIQASGVLQPYMLAVTLWSPHLLTLVETNDEHLIIDGSPRFAAEYVPITDYLDGVMGRQPVFVWVDVSDKTAMERMVKRNEEATAAGQAIRVDTATVGSLRNRIAEYKKHTSPVLVNSVPQNRLIKIDGEVPPEDCLKQLVSKLAEIAKRRKLIERHAKVAES